MSARTSPQPKSLGRVLPREFEWLKDDGDLSLGYLKDSNAAAHSVDADIFYVVINPLSARSKSYIMTFIHILRSH